MSGEKGFQSVFARVEKKFLLDDRGAAFLVQGLEAHGFRELCFGSPLIQSLYFDTADYLLVRHSVERPDYKEKLRLRVYGRADRTSTGWVEIKKKAGGIVYKRRTGLPLPEALAAISTGVLPEETGQIGREIAWLLHRYGGLTPAALISCERRSFEKPEEGLRVTFDRHVRFRDRDFDMTRPPSGTELLPPGRVLAEVKVPGAYPLWLTRLLWESGARQTHFSKYGTAYTDCIRPRPAGADHTEVRHSA